MSKPQVESPPLRDFAGNKLEVGDIVAYAGPYSQVYMGRVRRFMPKTLEVFGIDKYTLNPKFTRSSTRKEPGQVALLSREMRHLDDTEVYMHFKRIREEA